MDDPATIDPAPPSARSSTGWILLAIVGPLGAWLVFEIQRTIGLDAPRIWELLKAERVFDLAMLDFVATAGWASLVLVERARGRSRWLWAVVPVYFVAPSLAIALYLIIDRRRRSPAAAEPESVNAR